MSDGPDSANNSGSGKSSMIIRLVMVLCLLAATGVVLNAYRLVLIANVNRTFAEAAVVRSSGLVEESSKHLAPEFNDSQGTLLADPPTSAGALLDPPTLVVGHFDSTDPESPNVAWDQFDSHLAQVTGRKVVDQIFDNGPAQLADIKSGKIQIIALHGADAPFLVNNYGYEPAAVLGSDSGAAGNHLDIIVPADSAINQLSDLRGHSLVCVVPSSVTGYRAAVALLMETQSLRPNIDYFVTWSLGQKRSIEGVAQKQYEAAAISDDKLQTLLQAGDVTGTQYRIIYQSSVIPSTTIGWFYNLKPELADKVKLAILSYDPKPQAAAATDAADTEDATPSKPAHFIPINYKTDFALVREIDDRFDPRLDSKAKAKAQADAQTDAAAPTTQP